MNKLLVLLPLAALALAACGDDDDATPATDPGTLPGESLPEAPADLDGREFLSTEVTGYELVEGSRVRLSFADGSVGASAGCNSMSGGYTLDGDVLTVGMMATTEMACEEPLMAQDTWLAELLTSSPTVALAGDTLTLTGTDATLTLVDREVADPDRPVEGTRWVIESTIENEGVATSTASGSLTITDGTAAVEAGCNTGSASVEVGDGTLTFGPLALTRMMCDETAMAFEAVVVATLDGEVTYEVEADTMTLMNGDVGLQLRAAD